MKWIPLLFVLIPFLSPSLKAQSFLLSGKITAEETAEPLAGVIVFVQDLDIADYSNGSGVYELSLPPGEHLVEVSILGMEPDSIRIELSQDTEVDFSLIQKSLDLNEVEITAVKRTSGITRLKALDGFGIYEAKKNEVIVLGDFAANKAANNARQIFGKVPGLNIWESDFAGLQLDIAARGLGPSRTANFNTRQNGYDMSADALGYPESYYMPALQAVEKIEIVRGAASLQYGSQFGGMLNFKLKEAPDKPIELNLEQSIGSFGLTNSFLSAGGRKNKIDYYAYYQYRRGDGWRENSGFDAHTAFARIGYQVEERLKIGFEYSYLYYRAQQPGGLTDERFNSGNLSESLRGRNWFGVRWNLLASTLDYKISNRTKFNVRTFGLFSSRDALGNLQQIGVPDNPNEDRTLISDVFRNFGSEARLLHEYRLNRQEAALIVGARYYNGLTQRKQGAASADNTPDFELLNPQDPEAFDYDFPSENHALFLENLMYLSPKLSITAGLRLEHIRTDAEGIWKLNRFNFAGDLISSIVNEDQSSNRRWVPLWGLGTSYYLDEEVQIYANYSRNFRSITFSDLRVVNPNFQLDSLITDENGFNMDIGIRGELWDCLNLDASLFLLRYNDRIGQYELPGSTTLFRTNIGNSRHLGVELFGELDIFKMFTWRQRLARLSVFLNLSVTDATYIQSDISAIRNRRVEYVPNLMLRTGVNYRWQGIKATLQFSYLSEQYSDATNSTFNPNALTGTIPSYLVLDLSAEYELKRFTFSLGVNNLTDEKYFTRRAASYPGPGIIPATPRSFYFALGYRID
ncbi:MAG TPA: TonB-dependent receptor [Saprospiraceae bacterium]|nr:TonB-dependent receptor [Saprospiraceae bacterium]